MFAACGGDEETPTLAEATTQLLTARTWKLNKLTVDGTDQTSLMSKLTLNFSKSGFTATQGDPVWPASGTWAFTDDTGTVMKRSDGVEVAIVEVTDAALTLRLTWAKNTLGPGRSQSVAGVHTFAFVAQ